MVNLKKTKLGNIFSSLLMLWITATAEGSITETWRFVNFFQLNIEGDDTYFKLPIFLAFTLIKGSLYFLFFPIRSFIG